MEPQPAGPPVSTTALPVSTTALPVSTTALPVSLALGGRHADAVRRHLEGVLGWQAVDDAGAAARPAGLVPAAVRFVDVHPTAGVRAPHDTVPTVVLIAGDDDPRAAARVAGEHRPDAVLAWPDDRGVLAERVADLLGAARRSPSRTRTLRVGGASGGVGVSTVVLALAGLVGWSGRRTLAAVRAGAPVGDVRTLPPDALGAVDLWGRATPLAGAGQARVVGLVGAGSCPPLDDPGLAAAVLDEGVATDVDVLVLRPDAAGLAAAADTAAGALVVVGRGPAPARDVAAACGSRRRVEVPRSARVAHAGLHARVPTSLPGSFLRELSPLIPDALRVPFNGRSRTGAGSP